MKKLIIIIICLVSFSASAQNIGIGTQTPNASAKLDISDTASGILIPRMTTAQRNAIVNPATGLMVYTLTDSSFYFHNNRWNKVMNLGEGWNANGNSGTDFNTNFIGTIDSQSLRFKVANRNAGQLNIFSNNTAFGYAALDAINNGSGNTAFGHSALAGLTVGSNNVGVGFSSMFQNQSGNFNTAIGEKSGFGLVTGSANTFIGKNSKTNKSNIQFSTAIGNNATVDQDYSLVLGDNDTKIGFGNSKPFSQLCNTDSNMASSVGIGLNINSISWATPQQGFAQGLYNGSADNGSNGLLVKIAGTNSGNVLMDLSTAAYQTAAAKSVLLVKGNGRIGINNLNPLQKLDVKGNIVLNDSTFLLRGGNDFNHYLKYSSSVDGPKLNGFAGGVLSAGSGDVLYWNSAGNIGIGTSTPASTLHVKGAANFRTVQIIENSSPTASGSITLYNSTDGTTAKNWYIGSGGNYVGQNKFTIGTGNTNRFVIDDATKNVGIGTDFPSQKLDVKGNIAVLDSIGIGVTNPHAQLQLANTVGRKIVLYEDANNDNQYYGLAINPSTLRFQSSGDHAFFTGVDAISSVETIRIKSTGNVGIGNGSPPEKLTINGAVKISDGGYTTIVNNAATPVPAGGAGTMVFLNNHFFGWTGTTWKQLDN